MDCRTLGLVQHFGLNKGLVDILSHFTAKCIDFTHQMSLGGSANVRITGHHGNAVHIHREDNRTKSDSGCSQRGLAACMPRADHTDICFNMI